MVDLRIQIVNYRTKAFLLECLPSLFESLDASADDSVSWEVAVIDNGSGEDLTDLHARFPGRPLEVHQGTDNVGFGGAHNRLARLGQARCLFLLNPDTRMLEPGAPQKLVRALRASGAQVIGPRLVTPRGTTQRWDHGELHGWIARATLSSGHSYWRERATLAQAAWVSGAAFVIDKPWFDRLEGFDERFFLYKEEEELCWRLRAAGGTVIYEPGIAVFHHCGVVARKSSHLHASTDHFLWKHFRTRRAYPLFRLANHLLQRGMPRD